MSWEAPRAAPDDDGPGDGLDDGPDHHRPGAGPLWAVDDVARRAVESAEVAVARLLDLAGRATGATPGAAAGDAPGASPGDGGEPAGGAPGPGDAGTVDGFLVARATMARSLDLVLDLFRSTFDAYADLAEAELRRQAGAPGAPGPAAAPAAAPVTLVVDAAGLARGTFWAHNTTDAATVPESARVTDLWAIDVVGAVIPGDAVAVEPAPLPPIPPGGSLEVALCVGVGDAEPGRYVGHVLTSHGALALAVDVSR